jgi:hypothetical protein
MFLSPHSSATGPKNSQKFIGIYCPHETLKIQEGLKHLIPHQDLERLQSWKVHREEIGLILSMLSSIFTGHDGRMREITKRISLSITADPHNIAIVMDIICKLSSSSYTS